MEIGTNNVILVAHPDDETLWAGGLPIRYREQAMFTIIACSIPRRDPIRAWKFFDACQHLGALPRLLPFLETDVGSDLFGLEVLGTLSGYDCIITHGEEGDYGHSHHRCVHRYAAGIVGNRKFITFCYDQQSEEGMRLLLTHEEQKQKYAALSCYDHVLPYNGVEMTKCEALIDRYFASQGREFGIEGYR